jgi:hypothetical protein
VIAKLRSKLKSQSKLKQDKRVKINLQILKDETVRKNYENEVTKNLKENIAQMDVDLDWEIVRNAVNKAAATSIGELKRSRNIWYNDVCRISIDKRCKARDDFIKNNTQMTKEVFIRERKICKSSLQREKRNFFSNVLQTADNDHTQGRTRNFFRVIKQYKHFNPIWNAIRDQDRQMLMEPESRADIWKGYFEKLLNDRMPGQPVEHIDYESVEPHVKDVSLEEVKIAIFGLKNRKAPDTDDILKILKYGGEELHVVVYKFCHLIWMEERVPGSWNEGIIIPVHKKGDKTKCNNYRGISLLISAYKVFSRILLNRIISYSEDCLGEYQCGFWKDRSTTEQLSIIGQIIEKRYEYRPIKYALKDL